jgi:hypothetical protein
VWVLVRTRGEKNKKKRKKKKKEKRILQMVDTSVSKERMI